MPRKKRPPPHPTTHASPGTGTIYQIKQGKRAGEWRGAIKATLPDGTRKWAYAVGKDEASTRAALYRRWAALEGRPEPEPDDRELTVDGLLARWLKQAVKGRLSERTFDSYSAHALHLTNHIGAVPIAELTRGQVQRCFDALLTQYAPGTVSVTRAVLRGALNWALDRELIGMNAASRTSIAPGERAERHTLTPEQAQQVIRALDERRHPYAAIYRLMLSTGLRRGEAIGLRWENIDFAAGELHVRQQITRGDSGITTTKPKTAAARRTVPLMHSAVELLRSLPQGKPGELVFRRKDGKAHVPETVGGAWTRLLVTLGLPHVRLHDLRHTFATLLIGARESPREVMQIMGHANIAVTLGTYAHAVPGADRAMVDRLERQLWHPSENDAEQDTEQLPPSQAC